jgi:hypothetical protein
VDNGLLVASASILGVGEADQSSPTPSWPTTTPHGADSYTIEIPDATPITDADTFTFSVDDSAEAVYRLGNAQQAAFVKFGERTTQLSIDRDFESKADYDTFKAVTAQAININSERATGYHIDILVRSMIKSSYEVGMSGQGDLIRASIQYEGKYDLTNNEVFTIETSTDLNVT